MRLVVGSFCVVLMFCWLILETTDENKFQLLIAAAGVVPLMAIVSSSCVSDTWKYAPYIKTTLYISGGSGFAIIIYLLIHQMKDLEHVIALGLFLFMTIACYILIDGIKQEIYQKQHLKDSK